MRRKHYRNEQLQTHKHVLGMTGIVDVQAGIYAKVHSTRVLCRPRTVSTAMRMPANRGAGQAWEQALLAPSALGAEAVLCAAGLKALAAGEWQLLRAL
jgi:hypothetical protein